LDGEQVSEVQDEVELKAQDNLADLDSCPSGSMGASNEADHELKVDQITDDLLESILRDFKQDSSVKMVVEDDVDEDDFEDYCHILWIRRSQNLNQSTTCRKLLPPLQQRLIPLLNKRAMRRRSTTNKCKNTMLNRR